MMTQGWILMTSNETHCKDCQIVFDSINEVAYADVNVPCCPRCGSTKLETFRVDGKIVKT